jgi:hypothetical protein
MVKDIPETALGFYGKEHLMLRESRSQLENAARTPPVNLTSLSDLERKLVQEAFANIAEQGMEILVTSNEGVYARDLERMRIEKGDRTVYLLCDQEGGLQDITPLLSFVSEERRDKYERLRDSYLGRD